MLDEDWIENLSRNIVEAVADGESRLIVDGLRAEILEAVTDEIKRRVELEVEERQAIAEGGGVGFHRFPTDLS